MEKWFFSFSFMHEKTYSENPSERKSARFSAIVIFLHEKDLFVHWGKIEIFLLVFKTLNGKLVNRYKARRADGCSPPFHETINKDVIFIFMAKQNTNLSSYVLRLKKYILFEESKIA